MKPEPADEADRALDAMLDEWRDHPGPATDRLTLARLTKSIVSAAPSEPVRLGRRERWATGFLLAAAAAVGLFVGSSSSFLNLGASAETDRDIASVDFNPSYAWSEE